MVCAGIIEAGWLTAAIVVPLAFNASAARPYEPLKVALLRSLVGVMVLAWLVLLLEERARPAPDTAIKRLRFWLAQPLVVPVLLFFASYAVSTLFSIDPTHSVWGSFDRLQGTYSTLCYVALFGFIAGYLRTSEQIDRLVTAIILSSVPIALIGTFQYVGLGLQDAGGTAATGTLGNPIFLSSYLIFVVPLTLAQGVRFCGTAVNHGAVQKRQMGAGLFFGAVLAVQVAAIAFSGSRGPMVGLAGAAFVVGVVALPRIRHWLWMPWVGAAVLGMLFLVVVSIPGSPVSSAFSLIRGAPSVERPVSVLSTEDPTVRVRVLLWDAATALLGRSQPLGIPGDELAPPDPHHALRLFVGYGPETGKDVLTAVRPPEVAAMEGWRERVDRAHNKTFDTAVATGLLGVLAYHALMIGLLTHALALLGWIGDRASQRIAMLIMVGGGVLGATASAFVDATGGSLTFVGLGLPFGVTSGVVVYVVLRCVTRGASVERWDGMGSALGLALFSGVVGHFLEVPFAFSTAATNTYFWMYSGLLVALSFHGRRQDEEAAQHPQKHAARTVPGVLSMLPQPAYREASVLGLMMVTILVTLTMNPIWSQTPTALGVAWPLVTAWLAGLVLLLGGWIRATPAASDGSPSDRVRAAVAYSVVSLGGSLVYWLVRGAGFSSWRSATAPDTAVATAAVLAADVAVYVCGVAMIATVLAVISTRAQRQGLRPARRPLWLYLPCVLVIGGVIWVKNVDVLRADVYLKEAQRYRQGGEYETALGLHEKARSLDSDEGRHYSESAMALQVMMSDGRVELSRREFARAEGERLMLEARHLSPYDPDNATNPGRYYLGLAAAGDARYASRGVAVLQEAGALAPLDVVVHTLLARAHHMMGQTQAAIDQLQRALEVDETNAEIPPLLADYHVDLALAHHMRGETQAAIEQVQRSLQVDGTHLVSWSLLADYYLDAGELDQSLDVFGRALRVAGYFPDFVEAGLEGRAKAYASAGRMAEMVGTILNATADRTPDGVVPWVIGRAYTLQGDPVEALPYLEDALSYFERAVALAPGNAESRTRLTQVYQQLRRWEEARLTLRRANLDSWSGALLQAALDLAGELINEALYVDAADVIETVLASYAEHAEAHKSLGVLYYRYLDRPDEGVAHMQRALELDPEDADAPLLRRTIDEYQRSR